jgi:hypothetical protein
MIDIDEVLLKNSGFVLDEARSSIQYNPVILLENGSPYIDSNKIKHVWYRPEQYYTLDTDGISYILATEEEAIDGTQYFERIDIELCYYKSIVASEKDNIENIKYDWEKWSFESELEVEIENDEGEKETSKITVDSRSFWYKIKSYYEESA